MQEELNRGRGRVKDVNTVHIYILQNKDKE